MSSCGIPPDDLRAGPADTWGPCNRCGTAPTDPGGAELASAAPLVDTLPLWTPYVDCMCDDGACRDRDRLLDLIAADRSVSGTGELALLLRLAPVLALERWVGAASD